MLNADNHISISGNVSSKDDLDYSFLRQKGIDYIAKLGGKIWTDYNSHDPGITILEALCYAITDLGLRINLPIEDLLSDAVNANSLEEQFIRAEHILPCKPVTAADYRKLFIDIDGVKNAWLKSFVKQIFVDCQNDLLSYQQFEIEEKYKKQFKLKGLYEVLLDFDDFDPEVYNTDAKIAAHKKQIELEVRSKYHQNRNLCEDLMSVKEVPVHPISVCAIIDVKPETDEELVHANILLAINKYFSPAIRFYSLQEMLDKGIPTTEIFDGPVLNNGFIDISELRNSELRKEIRLTDIVQLIMNVEGVNLIRDISINNCDAENKPEGQPWIICIDEGTKPGLCSKSAFSYTKGVLPVNINQNAVKKYIFQLEKEEAEAQKQAQLIKILDLPVGEFQAVGDYTTIQNSFPETYGIGEFGLSPSVSDTRKAQAKQLQAYLLFFDQILASYFSQLDQVKELLSVNHTVNRSYFTQVVQDLNGIEYLIPVEYLNSTVEELSEAMFSKLDKKNDRKNQLLDHLLARFAENFGAYAFLMKQLYGNDANLAVIQTKENFLKNYRILGTERGTAFNYHQKGSLWNTLNVSTVEKRIALLTGMTDYSRRNLSNDPVEIYQEKDTDGLIEYRWRIKDADQTILCSATKKYYEVEEMNKELLLVKALSTDINNYEIKKAKSGKFYYNLINPEISDSKDEARIIARRIDFFDTEMLARKAVRHFISFMKKVKPNEGMYLVEHILLRPDESKDYSVTTDSFLPICCCDDCEPLDPYSFRVSVILPGWTERFSNIDFRNFMEDLIRKELPAHVLARICWIGYPAGKLPDDKNEMVQFERAYHLFLDSMNKTGQSMQTLIDLNTILSKLHSIYPTGVLYDCEDETENLKGKIILGRTNLGNI
ncbi:MAG TPA: hypothetical protein DCR40_17100 [Prolixibacteraceae bacterium]|nr:hypothetical protein [Prolixibacteraceae bacterium]